MVDKHKEYGPKQLKKMEKKKDKKAKPTRFYGHVDAHGNLDARMVDDESECEAEVGAFQNDKVDGPEPKVVEEDDAESEDVNEPVVKENTGFWF